MPDRKRALVVDDLEQNRTAIKSFLFFYKYDVEVAPDGLAARNLFGTGQYDLVVSDIEMPNMNGFELLAWIRQSSTRKETPVIMLSSLDSPQTIERCKKLGANAYIVKPFTKDKMEAALRSAGLLA